MTPQSLCIDHPDGHLHVLRWPNPKAPPVLLSHGTGFCAGIWVPVAERLSGAFDVFALDRRGHGRTALAEADVPLSTFGDDLFPILALRPDAPWFGAGHSIGSTDLLFAAAAAPDRFAALALHEPTVAGAAPEAPEDQAIWAILADKRRGAFASPDHAYRTLRDKPTYAEWSEDAFHGYLRGAFAEADGAVALRCPPEREAALCRTIIKAMHNDPAVAEAFRSRLAGFRTPTRLICSTASPPIFPAMIERLRALIDAPPPDLLTAGHCLPMERPAAFTALALAAFGRPPRRLDDIQAVGAR